MHPLLHAFLGQTAPDAAPQGPAGLLASPLVMIALMFVIFYLVVFRPQSKQRKQHDSFVGNLKKGDEVVTQSGIIGRIHEVEGRTVTLDVGGGTKIRLLKAQIASSWSERPAAEGAKAEAKK
jgi:preprotein translocase subunit YajC